MGIVTYAAVGADRGHRAIVSFADKLATWWRATTLSSQFALTATLVISIGMALLGMWVADRIVRGVVQNTAANSALYLVGFVEPHVQELRDGDVLSAVERARLNALSGVLLKNRRIVAIKVWARGGRLAYSSEQLRIGHVFPESDKLRSAWLGNIEPEYNELADTENDVERQLRIPILEVYAPVRHATTNQIIAVAEVYEVAEGLANDRRAAYLHTSIVVGSMAFVMIGSLFHIVRGGSRTIELQRRDLSDQVVELSQLLSDNTELSYRVVEANRRAAESNERFLRRISAELHDGPAQLVGLALLRLDALRPMYNVTDGPDGDAHLGPAPPCDDLEIIRGALSDCLKELRTLSAGIAVPELVDATLRDALELAARNHERRTNTAVALSIADDVPDDVSLPLRTCIYRLVQEGLNNAFRHAGGVGQAVSATVDGDALVIDVSDEGPGFGVGPAGPRVGGGLGLPGLQDRVQALAGELSIVNRPGSGVRIAARFDMNETVFLGQDHV